MRIRFARVLFALTLMGLASVPVHAVTVNFASQGLEDAVRDAFDALGTPLGGTIDSTDLDDPAFIELNARSRGITDIGGIEFCVNLETLLLGDNEISDISDLAGLTSLTTLDLGFGDGAELPSDPGDNNNVTDLTPLSGLTGLQTLNVAGNPGLSSFAPLAGLELLVVFVGRNGTSDYSVFAGMTSLIGFYCGFGGLTDAGLAAIAASNDLQLLVLPGNELTTLDMLENEASLSLLGADYNKITDISALADKTALETVFLNNNRLRDVQPLVDNSGIGGLDIVSIFNNPIRNDFACNQLLVFGTRFTEPGELGDNTVCEPSARALTMSVAGTGDTFPSPGITDYATGTFTTIAAYPVPGSGQAFLGWSGGATGTVPLVEINMASAQAVTASFGAPTTPRTLTISRAGEGIGLVTPGVGVSTYEDGSLAILNVITVDDQYFGGWSGDVDSIEPVTVVPMDGDKNAVATFGLTGFELTLAATGDGTIKPQPGTYRVAEGTLVNLVASPGGTSTFAGWVGDIGAENAGNANNLSITVTIDQARSITATFTDDEFDFSLVTSVTGIGDIDPGPPGLRRYNNGDVQNLTAATLPGSGYAFQRWEGDLVGNNQFQQITMDSNKEVTAVFVTPGDHELTVAAAGDGTGIVFPALGVHAYLNGTTARLIAFPEDGSFFAGWTGEVNSTDNVVDFQMDGDKAITANFSTTGFTLDLSVTPGGGIEPAAGGYSYGAGTVVNLTAFPVGSGFTFSNWTGDIGGANATDPEISVTMDQNRTIEAVFVFDDADWDLDITVVGVGTTSPEAGVSRWNNNVEVFLNPVTTPNSGFAFQGWTGDINTTSEFTSILMNGNKAVTATFVSPADFTLTMAANPADGSTFPLPGTHGYLAGRVATVTAIPNTGKFFSGWSGSVSGATPVTSVSMTANRTATASFIDTGFELTVGIQGLGVTNPPVGAYSIGTGGVVGLTAFDVIAPYEFLEWQGDIGAADPTDPTITVTMNQTRDVTAVFQFIDSPLLTLAANGPGTTFPAPGDYYLGQDANVFVSASPNEGAIFTGWTGDLPNGQDPLDPDFFLVMNDDKTLTANFAEADAVLTLSTVGTGGVLPKQGLSYFAIGEEVDIEAVNVNGSGFSFSRWEGDLPEGADATDPTLTITMDQNRTIAAIFVTNPILTVIKIGTGNVTPLPAIYTYPFGAEALLEADEVFNSGFYFLEWQGDIGDADKDSFDISVTMDQDRTVTAVFSRIRNVEVLVSGGGSTSPLPSDGYSELEGSVFNISAVDVFGSSDTFCRWEGDIGSANPNSRTIAITVPTNDISITAVFLTPLECDPIGEGEGEGEGSEGEGEGEGEGGEGEGEGEGETGCHAADQNCNNILSLTELLRLIQFYNVGQFHCDEAGEDGYATGPGDQTCDPHPSDYNPQNWTISLTELLRAIQFYNFGGFYYCPDDPNSEDGYCVGTP